MYAVSPARRWTLRVIAPVLAAIVGLLALFMSPWNDSASAHGSIVDPASRSYGCWKRWGSDHMNPDMETKTPCAGRRGRPTPTPCGTGWPVRETSPATPAASPTGSCAAPATPRAAGTTRWTTRARGRPPNVGSNFTVKLHDQASHGADYFGVYVTKQGFDPTTQPLGWSDLELVDDDRQVTRPAQDHRSTSTPPGRTGHHIVYTIWQASHLDQTYFICSDVNFG